MREIIKNLFVILRCFKAVKGFKKRELKWILEKFGTEIPSTITKACLKELILNSKEYEKDPDFLQDLLKNVIVEFMFL